MKKDFRIILIAGIIGLLFIIFPVIFEKYLPYTAPEFYYKYYPILTGSIILVIIISGGGLYQLKKENRERPKNVDDK